MKMNLYDKIDKTPHKVLYVQMCAMSNIPIGMSLYDEVLSEYPEYFPEEVEHKKKWESVPQEVKDAYWKEYWKFHETLWKNEPKSGGLLAYINDTDESKKFNEAYKRLRPLEEAKEKELHKKYYSKYGI
jgi:hypothetical protein